MSKITFITGNQNKADYLAKYLGQPVDHVSLDLEEIQSLDIEAITIHKVKQAYEAVKRPVIVEDVALEFCALGRLPGTLIKFFVEEMDEQDICDLLISKDRNAIAKCTYAYYDGTILKTFTGVLHGSIAMSPAGNNGFGWDRFFIPEGYIVRRAELNNEDYGDTYLKVKPIEAVGRFLASL